MASSSVLLAIKGGLFFWKQNKTKHLFSGLPWTSRGVWRRKIWVLTFYLYQWLCSALHSTHRHPGRRGNSHTQTLILRDAYRKNCLEQERMAPVQVLQGFSKLQSQWVHGLLNINFRILQALSQLNLMCLLIMFSMILLYTVYFYVPHFPDNGHKWIAGRGEQLPSIISQEPNNTLLTCFLSPGTSRRDIGVRRSK